MALTAAQIDRRKDLVGCSEIHDALLDPQKLFLRKTGRLRVEQTLPMELGHVVEPFVLSWTEQHLGETLIRSPDTMQKGRLCGHLDAWRPPKEYVVQAKQIGFKGDKWGQEGSDEVPDDKRLQVTGEMYLSECPLAYIPVLFGNTRIQLYAVEYDPELAEIIVDGVDRFCEYLDKDELPPTDFDNSRAIEYIKRYYKEVNETVIQADDNLHHWLEVCLESSEIAKKYSAMAEGAKAHMLLAMKNANKLVFRGGEYCTREERKRKAYKVQESSYIDFRVHGKPKETVR